MKINWGCGSIQPGGWINIDKDKTFNAKLIDTSSIESSSCDMIVAHCSIQMVEYNDIGNVLNELIRILKPGGVLRISLPDIVAGFNNYISSNIDWFPNGEDSIDDRFSSWLTWYSTTKSLLTAKALELKLYNAGFNDVKHCNFQQTVLSEDNSICQLDSREHECYIIEGAK